jgi:hypothetical protein
MHETLEGLVGAEAMLARSQEIPREGRWAEWTGETMIKQSSGDAALREAIVLAALGWVNEGRYCKFFPAVIDNPQLLLAVSEARGRWSLLM